MTFISTILLFEVACQEFKSCVVRLLTRERVQLSLARTSPF